MSFDYSEYKKFVDTYEQAFSDFEQWLIHFLQENGNWLKRKTIEDTPIKSGNLRRQWRITKVYRLQSTGNLGFAIVNEADYASFVENGHFTPNRKTWVDGYFMCTVNMEELERRLPNRFEKELIKFLKGYGIIDDSDNGNS